MGWLGMGDLTEESLAAAIEQIKKMTDEQGKKIFIKPTRMIPAPGAIEYFGSPEAAVAAYSAMLKAMTT